MILDPAVSLGLMLIKSITVTILVISVANMQVVSLVLVLRRSWNVTMKEIFQVPTQVESMAILFKEK